MKPFLNALLLADKVYIDKATNKSVIAGTFGRVWFQTFPGVHVGSFVYINLSDFQGKHQLAMRFVQLSDGRELAKSSSIDIKQAERLGHHEIAMQLPALSFPHPGKYAIEILWDGEFLGQVKLDVVQLRRD